MAALHQRDGGHRERLVDHGMNDQTASLAMLSVTQTVAVFTTLLPPVTDVRKAVGDEVMTNDVRMAEGMALGLVVIIGVTATAITKSPVPAMVSIAGAGGMVLMYESILATTPKEVKA